MASVISPVPGVRAMPSDPVAVSHLNAVLKWDGIIPQASLTVSRMGFRDRAGLGSPAN